jgi:hypothetical protein
VAGIMDTLKMIFCRKSVVTPPPPSKYKEQQINSERKDFIIIINLEISH